jgi:sugar phosphate isomerase/epimerase
VFSLSSLDREERERAVEFTLPTLEHAHEVGARAVVLHMGKTAMDDGFERLKEELEDGTLDDDETQEYIESLKGERKLAGRKHLDAALFSLDKLWKPAERLGLNIGIENRYHLKSFPNADEFEVIFDRFDGGNIGYWHDVGHGAAQETLYGIGHEELLARFSPHMVGVHLHDAEGVRDHQAPGKGGIDFEMVKKYVPAEAIHVIELSPKVEPAELLEGVERLRAIFR